MEIELLITLLRVHSDFIPTPQQADTLFFTSKDFIHFHFFPFHIKYM